MQDLIHYKKTLADELSVRQKRNPGYSLRAFARDLNLAASTLSEVLNGNRNFSLATARKVAGALKLPEKSQQMFLHSVRLERTNLDQDIFTNTELTAPEEKILKNVMKFCPLITSVRFLETLLLFLESRQPNEHKDVAV